jgi:hypothetical protein
MGISLNIGIFEKEFYFRLSTQKDRDIDAVDFEEGFYSGLPTREEYQGSEPFTEALHQIERSDVQQTGPLDTIG